jgi:hypothetical protein
VPVAQRSDFNRVIGGAGACRNREDQPGSPVTAAHESVMGELISRGDRNRYLSVVGVSLYPVAAIQ